MGARAECAPPVAIQHRTSTYVALFLAFVIAAIYSNSFQIGFYFDDWHVIEDNPHIRRLTNIPRFFVDVDTSSASQQNRVLRPLLLTTFALNHAVSGNDAWSYHLVNVLLHWLAAVLVFRIVRDHLWLDTAAIQVAVVAALVVATHPLNTSAVNYVSARSALLTSVFYLGAFDAAVRRRHLVSVFLFILALLTKGIAASFPLALLGYWVVARVRSREPRPWGFFAALCGVACAGLLYSGLLMPRWLIEATHASDMSPIRYLMTEWSAYLYYLRLFVWPNALVIDRLDYPTVRSFWELQAWGSLAVLTVLGVLAWHVRRRSPALTFAALWYLITLATESTIFPLAEAVNEHRPYLAMLGLATGTALGLSKLACAVARRARAPAVWTFAVASTFVVTALGATTVGRNQTWRDDYTLWLDATEKAPKNTRAWGNAGHAALALGKHAEARKLLMESYGLAPCYVYTLMNLSVLEWRTGDLDASLRWAEDAVRCNPGMALVHYYRGAALERVGRLSEALDAYRRTTAIDPQHLGAWFEQAQLLEQQGEWTEAAEAYERVVAIDPLRSDAAIAAGVICHYRLADPDRALEHYRAVLHTNPTHYGAHYQRAVALLASGKVAEAIEAWRAFVPLAEAVGDRASLDAAPELLRRAPANGNERKPGT